MNMKICKAATLHTLLLYVTILTTWKVTNCQFIESTYGLLSGDFSKALDTIVEINFKGTNTTSFEKIFNDTLHTAIDFQDLQRVKESHKLKKHSTKGNSNTLKYISMPINHQEYKTNNNPLPKKQSNNTNGSVIVNKTSSKGNNKSMTSHFGPGNETLETTRKANSSERGKKKSNDTTKKNKSKVMNDKKNQSKNSANITDLKANKTSNKTNATQRRNHSMLRLNSYISRDNSLNLHTQLIAVTQKESSSFSQNLEFSLFFILYTLLIALM